uniref:NADH dehydrogenase subunit 4L n=1 Tax=Baltalimania ylvae TaxID=3341436 RepID=A0A1X9WD88_9BILA|nr:NADH dehydrogenase subunit 4L [Archaphanostoma ylvae]ARS00890.1 NADH dehydrogenase subunit 4L [Archaphanostoma ylvae]
MIFFFWFTMIMIGGFIKIRKFTLLLLLNLEGLILVMSLMMIQIKIFSYVAFSLFSMTLLSLAVLEAALGLCLITLMMRYFTTNEIFLAGMIQQSI